MKRYIYMLIILLFFLLDICIMDYFSKNSNYVKKVYSKNDINIKYEIKLNKETTSNYDINIYYPYTNKKELNKKILDMCDKYILEFKNSLNNGNDTNNSNKKTSLSIKFDYYELENYSSFVFQVTSTALKYNLDNKIECINYNIDTNNIVKFTDVISSIEEYNKIKKHVTTLLINDKNIKEYISTDELEKIVNKKEFYDNFYFQKSNIVICINEGEYFPKVIGKILIPIKYNK